MFNKFIELVDCFLYDGLGVVIFCEAIDDLWAKEEVTIYNESIDQHAIASDIMMLCDKYDECDEIVKHDDYCINEETLRKELKVLLNKQ